MNITKNESFYNQELKELYVMVMQSKNKEYGLFFIETGDFYKWKIELANEYRKINNFPSSVLMTNKKILKFALSKFVLSLLIDFSAQATKQLNRLKLCQEKNRSNKS